MKLSKFIMISALILLGISAWINFIERKKEINFTAAGIDIRVLEAAAQGDLIKIVEPNGQLIIFSEDVKKEEMAKIAKRQKSLVTQADYFYHRVVRYIKEKYFD